MVEFFRRKTRAFALSAAVAVAGLQIILPAFLDLVCDALLFALVWLAAKADG